MGRNSYPGEVALIPPGAGSKGWRRLDPAAEPRPEYKPIVKMPRRKPGESRRGVHSYIFAMAHAEARGVKPPSTRPRIRDAIKAAGGFEQWCKADAFRCNLLRKARARAAKSAPKSADDWRELVPERFR